MSLSKKQRATLGRVIAARHEDLKSQAQAHAQQLREDEFRMLAGAVGDPVDQATAEFIRGVDSAAVGRDLKALRKLEAARARLAAGEYGVCIDCGLEIEYKRLIARPCAERCFFCQDMFERTFERTYVYPEGVPA